MNIPISKIYASYFEDYSFSIKDYNFMGISEIAEDEKEALYLDTSGEIINIVIGLVNPKYIKNGAITTVSMPVKITSVDDIKILENNLV